MRRLVSLFLSVLRIRQRACAARLRQRQTSRSRSPPPAKRPTKTASRPRAIMWPSMSAIPTFTPIAPHTTPPRMTSSVEGHVRIYRGTTSLRRRERRSTTSTQKRSTRATCVAENQPYFVTADEISVINDNEHGRKEWNVYDARFRRSRISFRAQKVRIYEGDRVIFKTLRFMSARCRFSGGPTFINRSMTPSASSISPAYLSSWGPSLLTRLPFR